MKTLIFDLVWVACGGALGAVCRSLVSTLLATSTGKWPLATLSINLLGCFVIGVLFGMGLLNSDNKVRLFLAVGFLGSLTTFSAFGLETVRSFQDGHTLIACVNVAVNVVGGLALVLAGQWLAGQLKM